MAKAVCRRPVTAEARVHSQSSPCEIYRIQSGSGVGFSQTTAILYHSTNAPYSSSSTRGSYQKDKGAGTFQKISAFSEIGKHLIEKYFHFFSVFKGEVSGVAATTHGRPESLPLGCYDLN
jgi:hypothetical protein